MGVGQLGERQFRFGTDGVQSGRIENHQSLLEQRMGEVDDRMAPAGYFDETFGVRLQAVIALCFDGKAQLDGQFLADAFLLSDAGQGGMHGVRRSNVQVDVAPLFGEALEFGHAGIGRAGFDRQQFNRRRLAGIEEQFGRAHGGATGAGGQDAVAVVAKEDGVDQFRFAAGELGDEGDDQLVFAQAFQQLL